MAREWRLDSLGGTASMWQLAFLVLWTTAQVPEAGGGADAKNEYLARKEKTTHNAPAHFQFGVWCEENHLKSEAEAEFRLVLALEPRHRGAHEKLGYQLHRGRWMTAEEVADEGEQIKADKVWYPRLGEFHEDLRGRVAAKRAGAEEALGRVDDPRAVPAVWFTFATGGDRDHALAVQLFGQIRSPSSSKALTAILLYAPSDDVARAAAETLRDRDPVEVARPIVGMLRKPWTYRLKPFRGTKQLETEMVLSTAAFTVQRFYKSSPQAPSAQPAAGPPEARLGRSLRLAASRSLTDASAYLQVTEYVRENAEVNEVFAGSRLVLPEDVVAIERRNEEAKAANDRVIGLLKQVFPNVKFEDAIGWRDWLIELEKAVPPAEAAERAAHDHLVSNPLAHPRQAVRHHPDCQR